MPINGVWNWTSTTEAPINNELCGGDALAVYGAGDVIPQEGAPCAHNSFFNSPGTGCYFKRECTSQDGCVYLNEDGTAVNPDPPQLWEKWKCVQP